MPANVLAMKPGYGKATIAERAASELNVPPAVRLQTPPAWLSPQARKLWREHVPTMVEETPELVSDRDIPALSLLFEH